MNDSDKQSTASRLGGQGAIFFAGNVFTLLVGMPLQVYVARTLGAEDLGIFSLIEGGIGLAAGLLALGLAPTLVKFIPVHLVRGEYACVRTLVSSGMKILLAVGSFAFLLLLFIFPIVTEAWPVIVEHQATVVLMGLLMPIGLVTFFLQQGLRGFQEIRYMVLGASFMQLTVKALLAVLLLGMGFGLIGYALAVVISVSFAAVWMGLGLRRRLSAIPYQEERCNESPTAWFRYARVMYSGSLLGIGSQYLDRFLLGLMGGPASVGVLMILKYLQQLPVVFLQMFLAVAAPMFAAAHARNDRKELERIYHLTTDWIVRLSAPLFIFFIVFTQSLLGLFGEVFARDGVHAFWIMLVGQVVNLLYGPLGSVMNMSGMESQMLKLIFFQSIISLTVMLALVPFLGLVGVAIALSASVVFINVFSLFYARKAIGLRWYDRRYMRWLFPLAMCISAAILMRNLGPSTPNAALLAVYVCMLYGAFHGASVIQGLHDDDREVLRLIWRRLSSVKSRSAQ